MKQTITTIAILLSLTGSAIAAEHTMICKNPRREYLVVFREPRTMILNPDSDATRYRVLAVEKQGEQLFVAGLTVKNGPTFRAYFNASKKLEYYAHGKLMQTDKCR